MLLSLLHVTPSRKFKIDLLNTRTNSPATNNEQITNFLYFTNITFEIEIGLD